MRPAPPLIAAACLAFACSPKPPSPAARPVGRAELRIASWNVHDLFDAEDRLLPPGDLDAVLSPEAVAGKLARVAAVLARVDADLVLLQEVENQSLAEALAARAGYGEVRLVEGSDPRGIDVALLSRFPVDRYTSHLGEAGIDGRPLWSRDCVEARVAAPGGPVVIVFSHLVSRITDPDGDRRREQAARMREIADEAASANPGALVVVGGDLNDEPWSGAMAPLLVDGAWVDALSLFAGERSWTWLGDGGGARLDYLLVPQEEAWRVQGASVMEGPEVAAASDHRPVVLELKSGR